MGDFFSGSKSETPEPLEPKWQRDLRKRLGLGAESGAMERLARAGEPYGGELVAPLGEYEQWGLGALGKYLQSPSMMKGGLWGAGREELMRTLGGEEYDPFQGEYYKAFRSNVLRELGEAKDRLASRTSAADRFFSGGRVAGEAELEETAMGGLMQTLGGLQEAERMRRFGAIGPAMGMAQYEEMAPLGRIAAAQQYGALPRQWEQSLLDAQRAEYMRQLQDLGIPLEVATGLSTYQPPYYQPTYGPSGAGSFGDMLGDTDMSGGWLGGGKGGGLLGSSSPTGSTGSDIQLAMMIASMFSDVKLKKDIKTISNALDKLNRLDGKAFTFINGVKSGGVVAQEMERVMPESINERDGYKTVDYTAIIGLLINAIKELNAKVNAITMN